MSQKTIPFIKMNGAGNDFVFLTREDTSVSVTPALARRLLDRHFGVGGDQLVVFHPPRKNAGPSVQFFNSDGSEAEMCGNGTRALANYLRDVKGQRNDFVLKTKAGPIGIRLSGARIEVDMGEPILEGARIPVKARGEIINRALTVGGKPVRFHAVSMGNPHAVIFVSNVENAPVTTLGPLVENHPFFPKRVNVEFVQVVNRSFLKARVWERGAGETLACGTGACAIAVVAARAQKTNRSVRIALPGGDLGVRWADNNRLYLSGPAEINFRGQFQL